MAFEQELEKRSGSKCEICSAQEGLSVSEVPHAPKTGPDACIYVCSKCLGQFEDLQNLDLKHFYCLQDSMWSEHAPVQVMAYRLLHSLRSDAFAQGLLDQLYLDEDSLKWADLRLVKVGTKIGKVKIINNNNNELTENLLFVGAESVEQEIAS